MASAAAKGIGGGGCGGGALGGGFGGGGVGRSCESLDEERRVAAAALPQLLQNPSMPRLLQAGLTSGYPSPMTGASSTLGNALTAHSSLVATASQPVIKPTEITPT
eukprot:4058043-Prymnesium_polylepis.1